jgi:hypothetical protein
MFVAGGDLRLSAAKVAHPLPTPRKDAAPNDNTNCKPKTDDLRLQAPGGI